MIPKKGTVRKKLGLVVLFVKRTRKEFEGKSAKL
jgi:hypothetical protein